MSERSRRTLFRASPGGRLATAGVAVSLVVATGAVWLSPADDLVAPLTAAEARLAEENAALAAEVEALSNSLEAREAELADLQASTEKAAAERAAGATSGKENAEAEKAAAAEAERQAAAQKAAQEEAEAAARGQAKGDLEKALAEAEGDAEGADVRAAAAEAAAARARAALAAAQARAPAAPQPAVRPTAPPRSELLRPATRYFGLYTAQSPFSWAEYDDLTARVGVKPTIAGYFQGWDGDFRADAVTRSWAKGALPLLTWESRPLKAGNDQPEDPDYSLPVIIGDPANGVPGRYDDYLHQYARDVAALGLPLAIRLDHEMNGSWYPWGERRWGGDPLNGNRKGDFVTMWRHVHDIFEAEGANRYVIWVWAPNIVNGLPDYAKYSSWYMNSLYPGDEYVDWVGLSGYYRPPYRSDQTPTFGYSYDRSLGYLREITDKPILLAEIGASEIGGAKPQWVADLFTALARRENADIIGFAWFSQTVTTISGGERVTNDWRINSRADSQSAFVTGINDPAAGFVAPLPPPSPAAETEPSPTPTAEAFGAPAPEPVPEPAPMPPATTQEP